MYRLLCATEDQVQKKKQKNQIKKMLTCYLCIMFSMCKKTQKIKNKWYKKNEKQLSKIKLEILSKQEN